MEPGAKHRNDENENEPQTPRNAIKTINTELEDIKKETDAPRENRFEILVKLLLGSEGASFARSLAPREKVRDFGQAFARV